MGLVERILAKARFQGSPLPKGYETTATCVDGAGETGALVFDAIALSAERAFFAGIDFRAPLAEMAALSAGELPAPRAAFCWAFLTFAQRAFCPATILARASGLTVRSFFALFTAEVAVVAFLRADTAEKLRTALFFKTFLDFAQRARCAAAILSRASALNVRFFLELPAVRLRPDCRFLASLVPISGAFTCCSRDNLGLDLSKDLLCVHEPSGIEDNVQLEFTFWVGISTVLTSFAQR